MYEIIRSLLPRPLADIAMIILYALMFIAVYLFVPFGQSGMIYPYL